MAKTVYVGMSGGVDSSVTAALLKEQGYTVVGVYMKNWTQDLPGFTCPWMEDYQDAKRVAVQLGIDFKMYDFEKEYRHKVVDYMIEGYKAGYTPNPDIMCNQEVKFKLFLETALEDGADMIATGHYARIQDGKLLTGIDANKDQSYFLYRVTEDALRHTLMPIGGIRKASGA
jgi:tRNA-specific 2-thiouridylase